MSANGTFSRPSTREGAQRDQRVATLRDVAIVMAVVCGVATFLIEPRITRDAISWEPVYRELGGDWRTLYYQRTVKQCLLMMGVGTLGNVLLFFMVSCDPHFPPDFFSGGAKSGCVTCNLQELQLYVQRLFWY